MSKPTVAIVGRPNVGKSTLFNRLIGGRVAIVADQAGTTRDRHFGDAEWNGRPFWVVDTGGMVPDSQDSMDRAIRRQAELAIEEADLIMFVVDSREGFHPIDQAVAEYLRRSNRPVLLVANKLDNMPRESPDPEFYSLGLGEPVPVSAAVGKGSGDLLDAIVERLPPAEDIEASEEVRVAIVGRPNVGKSSLVNRLLGEDRHVVSPVAGTTRDAIDSVMTYHGRTVRFIDTAGLRRKSRVDDDVEFYSTVRTSRAIEDSHVCVLVVDAAQGVHHQDLRIATDAWERGKGLVVAVNKWDLVDEKDANTAVRGHAIVVEKAPFLADVPFVYLSAETGQRARKILDSILEVAEARTRRVATAEVNKVLESLLARNQPPQKSGEEVRLFYASQIAVAPPTFALISNRPDDVPEHYLRYLTKGFREAWAFSGVPLRLKLRARKGSR
ncbi:MAG: ribosome biogenesis GTPase Der [Gemmatimonadales bacterium]|nr:ribosome biogenesis GTPase Der [Gemmatimonadales bacterium]